jgi:hypothetical protein
VKRVGHSVVPNPVYRKIMVLEAVPRNISENDAVASMVDKRERGWVAASDTGACAATVVAGSAMELFGRATISKKKKKNGPKSTYYPTTK